MLTVVYMKVLTKNTNKIAVKGMTERLRTSQTEVGSIQDKNLINFSLQSISWIITTKHYFY